MSTLSRASRRAIKEGSRPLTLKAPLFTTSDFLPLVNKVQKLEQERQELKTHSCTCDRTEIPCCSYCAEANQCWFCFGDEKLFWDLFYAAEELEYLKAEYTIPTFSAEEVSTKGAKKDRTCWNHEPTVSRLRGVEAKRRRAKACASKLDL